MFLYNFGIFLYGLCIRLVQPYNNKARLWVAGRRGIFHQMERTVDKSERIVWVHTASLGEFEQGRPVIERIKALYPQYKIALTFFSPSGYEVRKNYAGVDYVFYLPLDTPRNARRFVEALNPECAIFVKYEFWLNTLSELRRRGVKTYLISAIFRQNSVFFKPYGGLWRKALRSFKTMFVQNEESKQLLASIGYTNVEVVGDTRFDRVVEIAKSAPAIEPLARFKGQSDIFMAGSTWEADEQVLRPLIAHDQKMKFVIAPHEVTPEGIERLQQDLPCPSIRLSSITPQTDLDTYKVLIIDTIGLLSSAYQYASVAYIGGGFGAGIHNTLEAATFSLPVFFGPVYHKFKEAREMVELGCAHSISSSEELRVLITHIENTPQLRLRMGTLAAKYVRDNCGATDVITEALFGTEPRQNFAA